jgi:hypothetical protein
VSCHIVFLEYIPSFLFHPLLITWLDLILFV